MNGIYGFGIGADFRSDFSCERLGLKGARLAEMTAIGLAVPPGFTISSAIDGEAARADGLGEALHALESTTGKGFGATENPLLVSVRPSPRVAMPGMLEAVLNLGLNDETVLALARESGNPRFAWDCYARFIQTYGVVVLGIAQYRFEDLTESARGDVAALDGTLLPLESLHYLVGMFRKLVHDETGSPFPQDVLAQLQAVIAAVQASWFTPRVTSYRALHEIPAEWGVAVTVQSMVFGNMGPDSGAGRCATRHPVSGEPVLHGEYLPDAQGTELDDGIRLPDPLGPDESGRLRDSCARLEAHFRDAQDVKFTVQNGVVYCLGCHSSRRTPEAALRIAVDLVEEGVLSRQEAVSRIAPALLVPFLHPTLDPSASRRALTRGLPASPGAATGVLVFSAAEAESRALRAEDVILVRTETSPDDVRGMSVARGVLTTRGGMTSHAAVVARGMARVCVAGASSLRVDADARTLTVGAHVLREGDRVTLDGGTGDVFVGRVATFQPDLPPEVETLLKWAAEIRRMQIRVNADSADDVALARRFGAEGVGLCRTEHMFLHGPRAGLMRGMIIAQTKSERAAALEGLLEVQREDFAAIFRSMPGAPVTIRLFDPPLHEFLPRDDAELADLARSLDRSVVDIKARRDALTEANPMLGHRGCRLGITFPEIYRVQTQAVIEAALAVQIETGVPVIPEIMIPLVGMSSELAVIRDLVADVADEVMRGAKQRVAYLVGTMIELPRAALTADLIAAHADFFSFGTNDLTQATFGFSRDDVGAFLPHYLKAGLLKHDPFVTLDEEGVGALIRLAVEKGRSVKPDLHFGLCGEQGGDPLSIAFCERVGLDYISCSPYRVPVASLAAAQATLALRKQMSETGENP